MPRIRPILFAPSSFIVFPAERTLVREIVTSCALGLPLATAVVRMRAAHMLDQERRTRERVEAAFALPAEALDPYVDERVALVRTGDETPINLQLASGCIARLPCEALPADGRFLSSTDVTDLVRHAEVLGRLATTDELTGIWNGRHFSRSPKRRRPVRAGARAARRSRSRSRRVQVDQRPLWSRRRRRGDRASRRPVRPAQAPPDILERFGGEEFALLKLLRITTSIGLAEADAAMQPLGDLLKRADQALYDAKRDGRNRVRTRLPAPAARAAVVAAAGDPPPSPIALAS